MVYNGLSLIYMLFVKLLKDCVPRCFYGAIV
nr:MAG TPA: hypothetical protein [Microviridae sp.]